MLVVVIVRLPKMFFSERFFFSLPSRPLERGRNRARKKTLKNPEKNPT
jgi:hypothetical protein